MVSVAFGDASLESRWVLRSKVLYNIPRFDPLTDCPHTKTGIIRPKEALTLMRQEISVSHKSVFAWDG